MSSFGFATTVAFTFIAHAPEPKRPIVSVPTLTVNATKNMIVNANAKRKKMDWAMGP